MGNGIYERCGSKLERPYLPPCGKEDAFDRLWEKYGLTYGKLVRYADDSVIICKNKKSANHALNLMKYIMGKFDLTLNPTKTVCMWEGKKGFDFLGIHHRRFTKRKKNGMPYGETYQYSSKKAMRKMKLAIKENINQRNKLPKSEEALTKVMNPKIVGWRNYYKTRNAGKWLKAIDYYILCTFTRWYNKKHQNSRSLKGLYKMKLNLKDKGLQRMTA